MKKTLAAIAISTLFIVGCDNGTTLAKVDSNKISQDEFSAYLTFKRIPADDEARTQRILEQYVERAALVAAIEKTEALDSALTSVEFSEFKKQVLESRYFEAYLKTAVTDEGVQNFYRENLESFQSKQVKVAHILWRVNNDMADSERQVKLTQAQEAYSQLTSGEDFGALALEVSEDKVSGKKGGDLGWIAEGAIDKQLSAKAFELAQGEFSEPFLTPFGFHIIKVIEEPQVLTKSFESVKGDVRYQLRQQAKQAEAERLLTTINFSLNK